MAVFTALALVSTFPLVLRLDTVIPGAGPGDNVAFLWSTWVFARAVSSDAALFRTDLLFAPFGTQLSLHTHATTHAALAWPWLAVTSVAAAHNIAILIGLVLNGYVTFLLAHRLAGGVLPALIAGWLVAGSAFVHVHLLGHMNLLHVWVIPAFVLALLRYGSAPGPGRAVVLGVAGTVVVYTDYYFAIYCALIALTWGAGRFITATFVPAPSSLRRASRVFFALAAAALALSVVIVVTGGFTTDTAGIRISARTARNPSNVAWLALLIGVFCRWPIRISLVRPSTPARSVLWNGAIALLVPAILLGPLLQALIEVVLDGEYVSPRVLWRSSPPGGDLLTLLLGHPAHLLTGEWTVRTYQRLGIDPIEQTLWLGLVPLLLLAAWRRSWIHDRSARRWLVAGVIFGILTLGPFLWIGGVDTGLTLPHAALRYLPGISNARMPGRGVVVVQLAAAVLLAIAWRRRQPGAPVATVLVALIVLESLPGRTPLYQLPVVDAVDRTLAGSSTGAVLELPTGLRDGFGERGAFDHRALVHQIAHGRPLAGGFVARLSPRTLGLYEDDPVLSRLLTSAHDEAVALPSAASLAERGFSYLVINRDLLDESRLPAGSLAAAGYRYDTADGPRELFRIAK